MRALLVHWNRSGPGRRWLDRLYRPGAVWFASAAAAALAVGAALVYFALWPQSRPATAHIVLDPTGAGAAANAQEWIATQVDLIRSERVARRVLNDLDSGVLGAHESDALGAIRLLSNLEVDPGQGGLVSVRYRADDPNLSAQFANAFVAAYDRVRDEVRMAFANAAAERARQRVSDLRDQVEQIHSRLQAVQDVDLRINGPALAEAVRVARLASDVPLSDLGQPGTPEQHSVLGGEGDASVQGGWPAAAVGRLQAVRQEFELAQQALSTARARYAELDAGQALGRPAMVVLDAAVPTAARPSSTSETLWIAAVAGALAGWLLWWLAHRIDPRVGGAEELASALGLPVFGALLNTERAAKVAKVRRVHRGLVWTPRAAPALT